MKPKIFFRADGNSKMGLGHVIRSLALAEMLNETFNCYFFIRNPLDKLRTQILEICKKIIILPDTENDVEEAEAIVQEYSTGNEIIVLDGYHFVTEYQKVFKQKGHKLVCVDDIHAYHFLADIIINHAGGVKEEDYSVETYTKFYLGLNYALLRKPFRNAASHRDHSMRELDSTFISLGGADPNNDLLEVLQRCEAKKKKGKYYVVLGNAYQHHEALKLYIDDSSLTIQILSNLSAEEMVFYMKKCAIAITPPSTTSYEYLSIGGLLYLKIIADNQININRYFIAENLAIDFECFGEEKEDTSQGNIENKFNGKQAKYLSRAFKQLLITTRKATIEDSSTYYRWANDPMTRKQSYNSAPIPLIQHENWFGRKVVDQNTKMFIMHFEEQSIGQVRFDIHKSNAIISYAVAPEFRGQGLGITLLEKSIEAFQKEAEKSYSIIGFVKFENIASSKSFRNLGFRESIATEYKESYKYTI